MGVSHTQWPHSITGAILACLWFAQGISPNQNSFQWHYRKECLSFTNHGHDKTPPTVFNPLSLWLTLPRDMGVSHTQWPPSIARAILACLWFAQGLHKNQKSKQQSRSMMFRVILCIHFYRLTQLVFSTLLNCINKTFNF